MNINFEIRGDPAGKTIIFLHGWGGSINSWLVGYDTDTKTEKGLGFGAKLADLGYNCIFIDIPGFGKSDIPNKVWSIEDYTNNLIIFLETNFDVQNKNPILIGHSFGGCLSLLIASRVKWVSKICIFSGAAIPPKIHQKIKNKLIKIIAKTFKYFIPNKIRSLILRGLNAHDHLKADGIMKEILANVLKRDLRKILSKIENKTLLFWGENDRYTPLWQGKKIDKLMPNSELIIYKDGRHGTHRTHIEQSINKFLEWEKI